MTNTITLVQFDATALPTIASYDVQTHQPSKKASDTLV